MRDWSAAGETEGKRGTEGSAQGQGQPHGKVWWTACHCSDRCSGRVPWPGCRAGGSTHGSAPGGLPGGSKCGCRPASDLTEETGTEGSVPRPVTSLPHPNTPWFSQLLSLICDRREIKTKLALHLSKFQKPSCPAFLPQPEA